MAVVELDHLPAQDEFYHATEDQVAFVGGVGTGKTMVASDLVLTIAAQYPRCGGKEPGISIFSNTFPQLTQGTMRTFFERCDHWGLSYVDKIRSEHKIYIPKFDAWIGVWSVDNPINFKSLELCFVWIDEGQAWDKFDYDMLMGRLRGTATQRKLYPNMPLQARITANPPHTLDHWIVDLTTKNDPDLGRPPIRLITASTYDNPFLSPDYIQRLRSNYDPETAEIELGGKFGEIGKGRIWRMFSRGKHVLTRAKALERGLPPLKWDPNLPVCWGQDFNIDPLCTVLFQWRTVKAPGYQNVVMYVLQCMQIRHSIIDNAVEEFATSPEFEEARYIAKKNGIKLYGDAAGNQGNRQTGQSDWEALRLALTAHGFYGDACVPEANPDVTLRWKSGNRMLEDGNHRYGVVILSDVDGVEMFGKDSTTAPLVTDLERMFYKAGTRQVEVPKVKDGVPVKLITHLADGWSYPIIYEYPVKELHAAHPSTQR